MSQPSSSIGNHPCEAIRKDGQPCTVRTLTGSRFCFAHDPAMAEERAQARQRGGKGKARTARAARLVPDTLRPVLTMLLDVLTEIRTGAIPPAQANAVATVAGAIVKVYASATVEQQLHDLQEQVDRLTRRPA